MKYVVKGTTEEENPDPEEEEPVEENKTDGENK